MKRLAAVLLLLCMLLSLSACRQEEVSSEPEKVPEEAVPEETPLPEPEKPVEIIPPPEDPLDKLLSSMTLEEKVGQLFFVRVPAELAAEDVSTYYLGGYILFGRDTKEKTANELIQTIRSYQDAAGIPLLIGVDEEGGSVVRVSSNPHLRSEKFPSPQKLFASGGLNAVAEDTGEKDLLLQSLGFNVNLAPVADVCTDPSSFIYHRTAGMDAAGTAMYVEAVLARMASDGMGGVLKHFPGYGSNADTHTGIAVDKRPYETFVQQDFLPFSAGILRGGNMTAVMVSHNIVECMDADLPASLSPAVHEILRTELAFDGVVMTDDLAMEAVTAYAEDGAVAVMAVAAGNDMVITSDYRTQIPKVIEAVKTGALSEESIDTACLRVLRWKSNLGLLQP